MSFAAMLMCRELGVDVRPALSHSAIKDSDRRKQGHIRQLEALGFTVTLAPAA